MSTAREQMRLETQFRLLRGAWFNKALRSNTHEREWESEEKERRRESRNRELKERFDAQTELIIKGDTGPVMAPECPADMD